MPPTDQEWISQLPPDQQPAPEATPGAAAPATGEYPGQVAEIYSGKNVYKIPYSAEIPFKQQGKIATHPIGKLINAYNQHLVIQPKYDATLKEYNAMRPEYEKLKGQSERLAELEKLQAWSEQNPELFKHVWDSYSNREKLALQQAINGTPTPQSGSEVPTNNVNQQLLDVIAGLKGELGELKEWKGSWEKQQEQKQHESNVAQIEDEIAKFKQAYPFIDIDTPGEDGVALIEKIIKHGIDQGYPTFKVAALEYLEPQLLERMKQNGAREAVKGIQAQNKQGIVATSHTPFPIEGQSNPAADAKKPDHVLLAEAKAMFDQFKSTT